MQKGEPMNDLISRQAAIDALDQIFDRCEEIEAHLPEGDPDRTGYKMYPDYMTVWKYLHQLPSAQPESKTGRWMRYGEDGYHNDHDTVYWQCNQCLNTERGRRGTPAKFCPNCGARMQP